jgi:hypothetical protein
MAWSPGVSKRSRHDTNPYEFSLKTPNLILSKIKPPSAGFFEEFCHLATKKHPCDSYQGYLQKEKLQSSYISWILFFFEITIFRQLVPGGHKNIAGLLSVFYFPL